VSVDGDGTKDNPYIATYTLWDRVVAYHWMDHSEPNFNSRLRKRVAKFDRGGGLRLSTVHGLLAKKGDLFRNPGEQGLPNGIDEEYLDFTTFSQLSILTGGMPDAIEVSRNQIGVKDVTWDANMSQIQFEVRSNTEIRPSDVDNRDHEEEFTLLFNYDSDKWNATRRYKLDGVHNPNVTDNDDWPNSGGAGSATLQPWQQGNCLLAHLIDPQILSITNAYQHAMESFSMPNFGFPDWQMP